MRHGSAEIGAVFGNGSPQREVRMWRRTQEARVDAQEISGRERHRVSQFPAHFAKKQLAKTPAKANGDVVVEERKTLLKE